MKYITKILLVFGILASSLQLVGLAWATDPTLGTVTATVTAQNISVSLDNGDGVSFGTIGTSSTKDTTTNGVNDSTTATNNGNITEKFNIKSENTASGNWTLGATAGSETYTMKFCTATCDSTPSWTSVGISPSYEVLAASVATSGTQVFDLQVGTPTVTTHYDAQTITVTIQATTP